MFVLLFLITALSTHSGELANQCVILDKPEELWALTDLVFLGTVVETKPTGIQGFHVTVDVATFRVERVWKGKPGSTVEVRADAFFEKGKQYLVFAGGKPPSTTLPCRWTELADRAKTKLTWLEKRQAGYHRLAADGSACSIWRRRG